ncbi:MAG: hypothetical protein LBK22_09460 [Tannerella sp.]|jgi:hypothetical protein|nr:hypothetical protein [Tannerella sp.]
MSFFVACGDKDKLEVPTDPGDTPGGTVDTDYDVAIVAGDNVIGLDETAVAGVYAKTIDFTASARFGIAIHKVSYGFSKYSGNGGIGNVLTDFATLPHYNGGTYIIDKSRGQLSASGEDLWINTAADAKVYVEVDLSYADEIPRYFLRLIEDDNSIVLKESFDLFVWGGDWVQAKKGSSRNGTSTSAITHDGTEIATPNVDNITGVGTSHISSNVSIDYDATLFLKNRGMAEWDVDNIYEMAGYVRISTTPSAGNPPRYGYLKTPALDKLTAATDITVEFDLCRFASKGNIAFLVEGAGAITSGQFSDEDTPVTDFPVSGTPSLVRITQSHAPIWEGMNGAVKYYTHFKFNIAGANAQTRIAWSGLPADTGNPDTPNDAETTGKNVRACIDNVIIRK